MSACLQVLRRLFMSSKDILRVYPMTAVYHRNYARRCKIQTDFLEVSDDSRDTKMLEPDNHDDDVARSFDDYFNSPNNELHSKLDLRRIVEREKKKLKLKILQRKYFKEPQEVNFLTWKAKEQIRFLNAEYPEEWTPDRLAESFPISKQGLWKLLSSSFVLRTPEQILRHDSQVHNRWKKLKKELSLDEGSVSPEFQHLIESGKLELLKNAGGLMEAPKLPTEMITRTTANTQRKVGRFESIVKDYVKLSENSKRASNNANQLVSGKLRSSEEDKNPKILKEDNSDELETDWSALNYKQKEINNVSSQQFDVEISGNVATQTSEELMKNVPRKIRKTMKSGHINLADLTYLEAYQLFETRKMYDTNQPSSSSLSQTVNPKKDEINSSNTASLLEELLPKYSNDTFKDSPKMVSRFPSFAVEDTINIPEHKKQGKGCVYKKGNAYYDENGEFLYRVPGSE
ncbi:uncharacterized protein LOC115218035 [Argonauta hians]